jgi:hypothetical protein
MQINFGNGSRLWIDNLDAAEVGQCLVLTVPASAVSGHCAWVLVRLMGVRAVLCVGHDQLFQGVP